MKKDLICWDSCVVIAWIKEEPARMKAIEPVVKNLEAGYYNLIVSLLVYPEVLESRMSHEAITKFERFMQNREALGIFAVEQRVVKKAQTIRNRTPESAKIISTPDAIHVATAIVSGANMLHTFDKGLLSLNGKAQVEGLTITACDVPGMQRSLFD